MARVRILGGILLLLATSCGGGSWGGSHSRFVNRTGMDEAEFQALAQQKWEEAQAELATQAFDLHAAVPEQGALFVPADARSLQVAPRNVVVEGETDVAAAALNQLPDCVNCPYRDPTGLIRCRVGFCQAYLRNLCTIVVPASRPENMGPYEMENCILWSLGYDVSGR